MDFRSEREHLRNVTMQIPVPWCRQVFEIGDRHTSLVPPVSEVLAMLELVTARTTVLIVTENLLAQTPRSRLNNTAASFELLAVIRGILTRFSVINLIAWLPQVYGQQSDKDITVAESSCFSSPAAQTARSRSY
jgi:hypothetical protein